MKSFICPGRPLDGLTVMSFLNGLVFFGPVSLLVRTTAGVSVSQFFLLQAALSLAVLLGEVPSGRLTDRIGCRRSILLYEFLFVMARVLLLTAFLTRSLPLFWLEAIVEGAALSFESGTLSAYLYGTLPPERYLTSLARVRNLETAGFVVSTLCYAGLYAVGGIPILLAASALTSFLAWLASFSLPPLPVQRRPPRTETTPRPGLAHMVLTRRALALIAALAALNMGQILVNFFYADKLLACGARAEWLTAIILGYSVIQMLSGPLLDRLKPEHTLQALAGLFVLAGAGMAVLGLIDRTLPAVALMLALPLLLRMPGCILEKFQNNLVDAAGQEERRAEALSLFNMSGSVFEVMFLVGSSAVAAAGPAACFGAAGLLLAASGWAAYKILS